MKEPLYEVNIIFFFGKNMRHKTLIQINIHPAFKLSEFQISAEIIIGIFRILPYAMLRA